MAADLRRGNGAKGIDVKPNRPFRSRWLVFGIPAIGVLALGWGFRRIVASDPPLSEDPDQARKAILNAIPLAPPLSRAQAGMERLGFTCTAKVNSSFQSATAALSNSDFLYCDRRTSGIVYTRWQAAVVHKDGLVMGVAV